MRGPEAWCTLRRMSTQASDVALSAPNRGRTACKRATAWAGGRLGRHSISSFNLASWSTMRWGWCTESQRTAVSPADRDGARVMSWGGAESERGDAAEGRKGGVGAAEDSRTRAAIWSRIGPRAGGCLRNMDASVARPVKAPTTTGLGTWAGEAQEATMPGVAPASAADGSGCCHSPRRRAATAGWRDSLAAARPFGATSRAAWAGATVADRSGATMWGCRSAVASAGRHACAEGVARRARPAGPGCVAPMLANRPKVAGARPTERAGMAPATKEAEAEPGSASAVSASPSTAVGASSTSRCARDGSASPSTREKAKSTSGAARRSQPSAQSRTVRSRACAERREGLSSPPPPPASSLRKPCTTSKVSRRWGCAVAAPARATSVSTASRSPASALSRMLCDRPAAGATRVSQ